jgi:hypothetical protein
MRYIRGHATRGKSVSPETREKLSQAMTGREHTWGDKISAAQRGALGPNWQGGVIQREGRTLRYVGREHPLADSYGYAYEHRLVAAEHMDRSLERADHVHHIDLDPQNNEPSNLAVLTRRDHRHLHNLVGRGVGPRVALWMVAECV